ncbi:putative ATP-grasp-modified RiPP [Phytoactinopolyspora mesophila]|uniref:Putative ATP-grasp-modified RiPP n=1 Tax=Phytoactinopolyspora mesophila TaxID=2650750 RepID=A0A7K3MAX5_9ACTN|nr:putative ATP-grasp-modified RiPP [Phytoactinopolyspora mesophila]NDL60187.1 putative ATP-grasp-modified RiPP [Phytoactinopolyspora mesophila]
MSRHDVMNESAESPRRPYGMRYLQAPRHAAQPRPDGVSYSPELQLTVGADGNPWKTDAMASETSTNNDGNQTGEDTNSDPW